MPFSESKAPSPDLESLHTPNFLNKTFQAFAYRQYRLLWFGAFTLASGTWMQEVAQNWFILAQTGSVFLLGLDAFLGDFPILLFFASRWRDCRSD